MTVAEILSSVFLWCSGLATGLGVAKVMTIALVELDGTGVFSRALFTWAPLFDFSSAAVLLGLAWWLRS